MKAYIYCTKAKPDIGCNSKIVAKFDYEDIDLIRDDFITRYIGAEMLQKEACVSRSDLFTYKPKYAISLTNLEKVDMNLSELHLLKYGCQYNHLCLECVHHLFGETNYCGINSKQYVAISRPPQNMQYAYLDGEKVIIISIRPEHVKNILNGTKTIELRKRVIKL